MIFAELGLAVVARTHFDVYFALRVHRTRFQVCHNLLFVGYVREFVAFKADGMEHVDCGFTNYIISFRHRGNLTVKMRYQMTESRRKAILLPVVTAIIVGLVSGFVGAYLFARPGPQGPQGEQGVQGPTGETGSQGVQGEPGFNGTNTIQQMIVSDNLTAINIDTTYAEAQWYNMSVFDSSMKAIFNVSDQSRILAEFATTVSLSSSGIRFRIVVDNQYFSAECRASTSPNMDIPIYVKILTGSLSAGQHTIEVQFYRVSGITTLRDRAIYMTELPAEVPA